MAKPKDPNTWIQTFTGRQFWPLDPRPEDVCIDDIAHALSLKCRFGGHCVRFYSVAQHCVLMSTIPQSHDEHPQLALWALMHDAAEAYLADIARPIKKHLLGFDDIEDQVLRTIAVRFNLSWPMPLSIDRLDRVMLMTEARDLMLPPPASWGIDDKPLPQTIQPLDPAQAEHAFLERFRQLHFPNNPAR